jgi:type II secretory pathway component PulK
MHDTPSLPKPLSLTPTSERGLALMLVIFMLALSSIVLVALTDSTYVAARLNSATQKRVKAEAILKSVVNVAQVLIKNDTTQFDSPTEDAWMSFKDGQDIPGAMIGLKEPNVRVTMQISSAGGKFGLLTLLNSSDGQPNRTQVETLTRLFKVLGFDQPDRSSPQSGSTQPQQVVGAQQMVVNLVDYLDDNTQNADIQNYPRGMEADLPQGKEFRNERVIDSLVGELSGIPGFSPERIQRLYNFVSLGRVQQINLNAAEEPVLQALNDQIDSQTAQRIMQFREPAGGGPFTTDIRQQLDSIIGQDLSSRISPLVTPKGSVFDVIAKVEYGTSSYMATAILKDQGPGRLPRIESLQMF